MLVSDPMMPGSLGGEAIDKPFVWTLIAFAWDLPAQASPYLGTITTANLGITENMGAEMKTFSEFRYFPTNLPLQKFVFVVVDFVSQV